MDKPEVFNMSILSDTAHENMINSEAAVTYILKALFSDVFKFDGTTEVMIPKISSEDVLIYGRIRIIA